MLDRSNNRFYIAQSEYGFIAPNSDSNHVVELASRGFTQCFSLAIRDDEARIALLAHIDVSTACENLIPESIKLLKFYGAGNLTLEGANLLIKRSRSKASLQRLGNNITFIRDYKATLKSDGFQVTTVLRHQSAPAVKLTTEGLSLIKDELSLNDRLALQIRTHSVWRERTKAREQNGKWSHIRNAYVPNLVLLAT